MACKKGGISRDYNKKVDRILKKHSGTGMKTFEIEFYGPSNANTYYHVNNWLEIAITSGIEELTLRLTPDVAKYNFPCSLLSDGRGDLIQSLHLSHCSFRPTVGVVSLRSLTSLDLCLVRITDRELGILLSNSLVLEKLGIKYCDKINCLKIPCVLERLSSLEVQFSIGEPLQMKNLQVIFPNSISFGRVELPFSMPNLETLNISSRCEILQKGKHDLTLRDPIYPRQMSERQHVSLNNVKINGFSSTKSLVELTCHILQNTTSLECLTLDTTRIEFRCSDSSVDVCLPSDRDAIKGAHKALLAIRTYIEGKVPATVKFIVLEPCRRCYAW
uniref:At1g61320/AtMIF1 LRR domain-containing protein n=1 Tax=Oryza meridionalis TaxID=40149 RepID=A0A0E0CXA6_9ORYZ